MRLLPVGHHALLVEVADLAAAQATYRWVRGVIDSGRVTDLPRDVVPAARTVLVDGIDDVPAWRALMVDAEVPVEMPHHEARQMTVPLTYDGPDLAVVARAWGCTPDDVVARHRSTTFTVAFAGFAPGFCYCSSNGALPPTPRRSDPRTTVPAGSVALADEYCGIYPQTMPGGWLLIGTTDVVLFDPDRAEPALLRPGDRLRFRECPG